MTILENIQNSREFPPGISEIVDSLEFANCNSRWTVALEAGGDPAPLPQIKTDVGLNPGHIALNGDPAPAPRKGELGHPNGHPSQLLLSTVQTVS